MREILLIQRKIRRLFLKSKGLKLDPFLNGLMISLLKNELIFKCQLNNVTKMANNCNVSRKTVNFAVIF